MSVENDKLADTRFSLRRWSNRKLAAARVAAAAAPTPTPTVAPESVAASAVVGSALPAPAPASEQVLPPIETLTFESDFGAFMQPKVAETVKRAALKKLFRDPHFNVMDGLDVYIDDYSIPSPLEPGLIEQMAHARYTLNPPKTRVTAAGYVEDVPPEEAPVQTGQAQLPEAVAGEPQALATDTAIPLTAHEDESSCANDHGVDETPPLDKT